jgi:hypothetical protein|tara:strand:- start:43 stop:252 length:210 start_codon:yes stop_codon:yes gene_type:complete
MTPELKTALETKLKDTDWTVLPDVVLLLESDNQSLFVEYRTYIRNELLGITSESFNIDTIPEPPTAVWI